MPFKQMLLNLIPQFTKHKYLTDQEKQFLLRIEENLAQTQRHTHRLNRPLKEMTFVVFDTETTGFHYYRGDKIIEIGALIIENGRISSMPPFNQRVNPERSIPPFTSQITGIAYEDVADKPTILPVLTEFVEYIGHHHLVAHCASFDIGFVNHSLQQYLRRKLSNPVVDTFDLARTLYHRKNHTLDDLLEQFEIQPEVGQRHTAYGDALLTAQLFLKMLDQLEQRSIYTLNDFHHYLNDNRTRLAGSYGQVSIF